MFDASGVVGQIRHSLKNRMISAFAEICGVIIGVPNGLRGQEG